MKFSIYLNRRVFVMYSKRKKKKKKKVYSKRNEFSALLEHSFLLEKTAFQKGLYVQESKQEVTEVFSFKEMAENH